MWGMRDRLIHDYGNANYKILYDVVSAELPGLMATIDSSSPTRASRTGEAEANSSVRHQASWAEPAGGKRSWV
jgi:hypothetical protein